MRFSNEELQLFKKPVGILIKNEKVSLDSLSPYLKSDLIISVGDATTDKLLSLGIVPSIQIVDGKEQRAKRNVPDKKYTKEIMCENPAGGISNDAINAVRQALRSEKVVRIIVDGEEDLIGAVFLALAPDNSVMLYGQPLEGLVVVRINAESRSKFREVINKIRTSIS
ncbi:MAG: GTP-dependent dephospho-CoA kinase family protein [Nitrososphaerales archaeon]